MTDVRARRARPEDVDIVAALHVSELPGSFLAQLGTRFLQLLYRRLMLSPAAVLLVASEQERVIGFVAGTEDTSSFYKEFLRRDGLRAAVTAAPRAVRHGRRIAETLGYSRRMASSGPTATGVDALPPAELLSLAVARVARRRGVGTALVQELQAELERRGVAALRVVVAADNAPAIQAYRTCGFTDAGRVQVHRGQPSQVLTWP